MDFIEKLIIGVAPAIITSVLSYILGRKSKRKEKGNTVKGKDFLSFFDRNYNSFCIIGIFLTLWYSFVLVWAEIYGYDLAGLVRVFPPVMAAYCLSVLCIKSISSSKNKRSNDNDYKRDQKGQSDA